MDCFERGQKLSRYHKIWSNLTANFGFTRKSVYYWELIRINTIKGNTQSSNSHVND